LEYSSGNLFFEWTIEAGPDGVLREVQDPITSSGDFFFEFDDDDMGPDEEGSAPVPR
jgi:hypothetical protein